MIKLNKMDRIQQFWSWFEENKSHYTDYEDEWDPGLERLEEKLHSIDKTLSLEITSEVDGLNEIIISADAFIEKFSLVREIVDNAPYIKGWRIEALKKARGVEFILRTKGFELNPIYMYFYPYFDNDALTIVIYSKNLKEFDQDSLIYYGRSLLINILGEYDVATKVDCCFLEDLDEETEIESLIPLPKVKEYIDEVYYNSN